MEALNCIWRKYYNEIHQENIQCSMIVYEHYFFDCLYKLKIDFIYYKNRLCIDMISHLKNKWGSL